MNHFSLRILVGVLLATGYLSADVTYALPADLNANDFYNWQGTDQQSLGGNDFQAM